MRHTTKIDTLAIALAIAIAMSPPLVADEAVHQEMDEFMAEAVSLLPVHSITAPSVVANAQLQTPADRAVFGEWGSVLPWPFIPVTAANLPDGRIVTFASNQRTNFPVGPEFTYAGVWDPATGQHTEINNDNHDMFCAAVAMGVDGRPIFAGGRNAVRSATVFDWQTDQWVRLEDMHDGRWYGSSTTMPDGTIVTATGSIGTGVGKVERFSAGSGWTRLSGVQWTQGMTYDFPHNLVAPDGRLIYTGPAGLMRWIDPTGNGLMTLTDAFFPGNRTGQSGGLVMYDEGKILFAGGSVAGGGTTNAAHIADISTATPTVTAVAPMQFRRRYHNALMLPDGKAIVIGGNTTGLAFRDDGSIFAPEMWDPATGAWTELADMAIPRNYHSVALLLPDGRIFSGGGGLSANAVTNHQDAQLFSPPYLFEPDGSPAVRPQIESAPAISSPGGTIEVTGSANIERFTMVRMIATTHAFSSDVRFLNVTHSVTAPGAYRLALHPNINVLVPGYWMLFGIDAQGTPSVASILKISAPTPPMVASPGSQHTLLGQLVSLGVTAGDGNGDPITFTASGLPAGLAIDPASGVISGRPIELGEFQVTISVTAGTGSATAEFAWTISEDPGLISYWPFDEGAGTSTGDAEGIGQDATLIGGASWTAGLIGSAISFDGVDDHILASSTPALEVGKDGADFSVSFWLKLRQESQELATIIHKGGSGTQNTFWIARYPNSRNLYFAVSTTTDPLEGAVSNRGVASNQWTHVALVKGGDELSLFIDGELDQVRRLTGTAISNPGPLYIGDDPWHGGTAASLDELAIYNRALSSSEITFLSNPANPAIGANSAPEITDPGDQSSPLASVSLAIAAYDADGDRLTFSDDGQLPPGLTLDPDSGLISGTPTQPGIYTPEITVSDASRSASVRFQWQIRSPIAATASAPGPVQAGGSATFSVDSPSQNLSFVWNFGDGSAPQTTSSVSSQHVFQQAGRYTVTVTISDDLGQSTQLSFYQAVHRPLTARPPAVSQSLAYEVRAGSNDRIWNANPDNDSVGVFDIVTGAKLAEIPVGRNPRALAIAPDGQVWVTNKGDASISRIDSNSLSVISNIDLPRASQPHGIVFAPVGGRAFVTLEASGKLIAIDASTGAITGATEVGENPRHLSVNHDASKVYVSRFITPKVTGESTANPIPGPTEGGEIVAVETSNMMASGRIVLHLSTRPDAIDQARGIPNYLGPAAISPDGTSAWVASKQDNIQRGSGRDGNPLTHDNTIRGITSRVDLTSGMEDPAERIDHDNGGIGSTSLFGRFGNFVFTALEGSRSVAIIDVFNGVEIGRIQTQRAPQGLAISPDGRTLYVHNFMSRSVTAHDLSGVIDGTSADTSTLATYQSVAAESLAPSVLLGKQHFYDSQDPRLALQEYISCASCHNDGAQDGRVWDLTGFGEGLRNTIDLRGRAGLGHGPLHWSANFDEVQDFENQIRNLSGGGGLITGGNPHPSLGAPNAGRSADLDALAAYVTSLASFSDSPSRRADGSLSDAAATGKAVFESANCASCHRGDAFTDSAPGILHDIGTIKPGTGKRLGGPLSGLDTPTLRGVATSAPYLHDGSADTLEEAVAAHASAASLTPVELAQIASYLREIDGTEPAPTVPAPATDELSPDPTTIALYHFNGDYTDASPNGLDLTATGSVTLSNSNLGWMQNPSGKLARFGSIGDTLTVAIPDELVLPSSGAPITIEARIFARNYLGYSVDNLPIIGLYQDWDAHLQLEDSKWGTAPAGPLLFASGGILADSQSWADAVAPNAWHRVQISFDGIGTIRLWIDGLLINSITTSPNVGRSADWYLTLGNFDGDIDELLISRQAAPPQPDTTAPSVALTTVSASVPGPFSVGATFSENVTGLQLSDLIISNGTASALAGSGRNYLFNVTPSGPGSVGISIPAAAAHDAAGNANTASLPLSVTYTGGGDESSPGAQTIALYHFNSDFDDASGHGLHLAATPGVTLTDENLGWMQSPAGKVARFRNLGDTLSVDIPDSLILPDSSTPITIEARLFSRAPLGYGSADAPIVSLYQDWDASLQLEDSRTATAPRGPRLHASGGILANTQQWADAAAPGQWHLLQISYDGAGTIRAWVDATPIGALSIAPNASRTGTWKLTLGNFDGDIDEVHVHATPSPPGAPLIATQPAVATALAAYQLSHTNPITAPLDGDSDGDGWIDLLELAHGGSDADNGAPDYHLSMIQLGGETFPAYSIPVISSGEATSNGFISTPFRYTVEASPDLQDWDEPIELTGNPASLPPAPAGYRFITFRLRSPSSRHHFFRTTVSEIR